MRIAMMGVGWSPDSPGGLNRYFRELHDGLVRRGHDVVAIVHGPAESAPENVAVVASENDSLPSRLLKFARPSTRVADAEVIDAHFALYAVLPVVAGYLRKRPLVVHFHGPWWAESQASGAGRVTVAGKRALERALYRRATRVVVLSDAFADEVGRLGVPPARVRKVRPGVDLDRFSPLTPGDCFAQRSRLGIRRDQRVVLAVRRLVPRMGLDRLIRAWSLRERDTRDVLVIAGTGPERPRLESLAATLDVAASVRFIGRVSDADLPFWYAIADLAVVPTTSLEGFGLVVLEALAAGTPVLASGVGGLVEALHGLPEDHVVNDPRPEAWAEALSRALDGTAKLADREQARRHAESFTWDRTSAEVETIYLEAIQDGPS